MWFSVNEDLDKPTNPSNSAFRAAASMSLALLPTASGFKSKVSCFVPQLISFKRLLAQSRFEALNIDFQVPND